MKKPKLVKKKGCVECGGDLYHYPACGDRKHGVYVKDSEREGYRPRRKKKK